MTEQWCCLTGHAVCISHVKWQVSGVFDITKITYTVNVTAKYSIVSCVLNYFPLKYCYCKYCPSKYFLILIVILYRIYNRKYISGSLYGRWPLKLSPRGLLPRTLSDTIGCSRLSKFLWAIWYDLFIRYNITQTKIYFSTLYLFSVLSGTTTLKVISILRI